jgi:nicotinate phosphoribosyltransferase
MVDIATRVHNHNWKIDPIVRSVLDTDFYKLLMAQTIFRRHRDVAVTFGINNRTTRIRLADIVDAGELREHLDHVRGLRLSRGESTWLRGNTFYGKRQMFSPEFMDWLETFRFPEYLLEKEDGQYVLTFHGPWIETTMWEIPALSILNELRSRGVLKDMGKFELQVLYARAMTRVWEKIERLRRLPDLSIADFGTRRRHSFLWQDWCVQAMIEGLGSSFLGTSNCLIALRREVEAVGTNAHELPMVYAALAEGDEELARAPYRVLADWQQDYEGNLRVILPDTYGTTNFLQSAPAWVLVLDRHPRGFQGPHRGRRGGHRLVGRARAEPQGEARHLLGRARRGRDRAHPPAFPRAHAHRLRLGHPAHQRFPGLAADGRLDPISIVCKVISANGRPAVKLSDNPTKAMGPRAEVERYMRVFEVGSQTAQPVLV